MSEMNGGELSDLLHKVYPHIKTLFMSGYTADIITHRGVAEEEVAFIQKPFSLNDFARKVSKALQQE